MGEGGAGEEGVRGAQEGGKGVGERGVWVRGY